MKYYPESSQKTANVNGVLIPVPRGVRFVTINMNSAVQGWYDRPSLLEGYWVSSDCTPMRLGFAELDFVDSWTNVFEVKD